VEDFMKQPKPDSKGGETHDQQRSEATFRANRGANGRA
jgi:hypothetical protein